MTPRAAPGSAAGFTMIELIVVSILMVVLAAVVVPRMVGSDARRARITAEAVRDLVSAAGEREALTSQPVALAFDAEADGGARMSLLVRAGEALGPGKARPWTPDLFVHEVRMEGLELERCTAGGIVLSRRRWRIPLQEGEGRARIDLLLRQTDGDMSWLVSLSRVAITASLAEVAGGAPESPAGIVDLDEGRGRDQPW